MPNTWVPQGNLAEEEASSDGAYASQAVFHEQPLSIASSLALLTFYFKHPIGLCIKILLSIGVSDPSCQDGLVKQVQSDSIFLYSIAF